MLAMEQDKLCLNEGGRERTLLMHGERGSLSSKMVLEAMQAGEAGFQGLLIPVPLTHSLHHVPVICCCQEANPN